MIIISKLSDFSFDTTMIILFVFSFLILIGGILIGLYLENKD